jgi:hypothetical protein
LSIASSGSPGTKIVKSEAIRLFGKTVRSKKIENFADVQPASNDDENMKTINALKKKVKPDTFSKKMYVMNCHG